VLLIDQSHRQAWAVSPQQADLMNPVNPGDACLSQAAALARRAGYEVRVHERGPLSEQALADVDVLWLPHASTDLWEKTLQEGSPVLGASELAAVEAHVRSGGGLLVTLECEQEKYGNNLSELTALFGVRAVHTVVQDPAHCLNGVAAWPVVEFPPGAPVQFDAGVSAAALYRCGTLQVQALPGDRAWVAARTAQTALPAGEPVIAAVAAGAGRVIVLSDSDILGDDSIGDLGNARLWLNLLAWVTPATAAKPQFTVPPQWDALAAAVEELAALQDLTGAVADVQAAAGPFARVQQALAQIAPAFPMQQEYLQAVAADLDAWNRGGMGVPDFLDSLSLFQPQLQRADGDVHLALFPMNTQNGKAGKSFEAVIARTFWPAWLADAEAVHPNGAFVPVQFEAFTRGYDTHSAVLFPETVSVREVPKFTWGAIFCDRESERFRLVAGAGAAHLQLPLSPQVELLLRDPDLSLETFALWDLVHDRSHSHGVLPFDPFMIKQRMPFWMYALEELRCDLEAAYLVQSLPASSAHLGAHVPAAVLLDRMLRFTVSGDRTRNYDGLAGQLLFAFLHRAGSISWRDNRLAIDWDAAAAGLLDLRAEIAALYHQGITQSRVAYWKACHDFVSDLVSADRASKWAGASADLTGEPRALIDMVLPDEFPLSVFFEALRRELGPVVEQARGASGRAGA
jgi:hypothetical protein